MPSGDDHENKRYFVMLSIFFWVKYKIVCNIPNNCGIKFSILSWRSQEWYVAIQSVRMKGIQNKKNYISETNCHTRIRFMSSERKTLKIFFMPGLRACASWWPSAGSKMMSTQQEQVQCVLWLAELQSLTAVSVVLERNIDVNLLYGKAFGSGTTNW
jgi:hypothetical protein